MTLYWKLQMMKKNEQKQNDDGGGELKYMALDMHNYTSNSDLINRDEILQNKNTNTEKKMEDDNMNTNADWIRGMRVKFNNVVDIKNDIKNAVEIMAKEDKVSEEYRKMVAELCNDKSNGNLVTITIDPDNDKMKFDDALLRGSQLKEMLDMVDVSINIGNVNGPNKMRRWYDEENIRRVVNEWLEKNPGVSIVYPNNIDNNENETENETTESKMESKMEETGMLNDYEREHLEEKLDKLNRIKSEYDKYEWLLDPDPDRNNDAKTQIEVTRLGNGFRIFLEHYELLNGIGNDAKREIIESAYDIIKRHRDETCKKLKTFIYKTGDNDEH